MLRLHNIDSDVIFNGLGCEIDEYARYAYQGNHNERSHLFGCGNRNATSYDARLFGDEEFLLRTRGSLWSLESGRLWADNSSGRLRSEQLSATIDLQSKRDGATSGRVWNLWQWLQFSVHGRLRMRDLHERSLHGW